MISETAGTPLYPASVHPTGNNAPSQTTVTHRAQPITTSRLSSKSQYAGVLRAQTAAVQEHRNVPRRVAERRQLPVKHPCLSIVSQEVSTVEISMAQAEKPRGYVRAGVDHFL